MFKVTIVEARRRLSELVDRAAKGERIGITNDGKVVAFLEPPPSEMTLQEAFAGMEKIRKRVRRRLKGVTTKSMVEEGRT
ncbi:MAG: type II toxin-antitoxin system prevent-host-death family antitoxin [Candidatus Acidiferrales bacterium]